MGVPEGFELTPEYEADVAEVMKTILPVNPPPMGHCSLCLFQTLISTVDIRWKKSRCRS
jgi:hypothetical protein